MTLTFGDAAVILDLVDGFYRQFGRQLRAAREKAGLTQQIVADRVGLTRTSVTNIERGSQHISLHQLYLLAAAVGCKPGELLPEHDGRIDELLPERALKALGEDTEGRDFAERVLRTAQAQTARPETGEK